MMDELLVVILTSFFIMGTVMGAAAVLGRDE